MKADVEEKLREEIKKLYLDNKSIEEIANIKRVPKIVVAKVLAEDKNEIIGKKKELGHFDKDKTIKTIDTMQELHKKTLEIIEYAREVGDKALELQALKEAREQTKIIMQMKGELHPDTKLKEDLIDRDFATFLIEQLKRQGIIEFIDVEEEGDEKTTEENKQT